MTENVTVADKNASAWWIPIWEFLVHAFVGTAIFILIALPAITLNLLVNLFQARLSLSSAVIFSLTAVEYMILASDLLLFSIFLYRSISRAIKLM